MQTIEINEIHLTGLALATKTTNEGGQSGVDCGNLWKAFEDGQFAGKIPGQVSHEIYGVYHQYEGDSSHPFSYFVGCKVAPGSLVPEGLQSLVIPRGLYFKMSVKGKMPDCVMNGWKQIWSMDMPRSYDIDFEIYDERSKDWNDAEVDICLSIEKQ